MQRFQLMTAYLPVVVPASFFLLLGNLHGDIPFSNPDAWTSNAWASPSIPLLLAVSLDHLVRFHVDDRIELVCPLGLFIRLTDDLSPELHHLDYLNHRVQYTDLDTIEFPWDICPEYSQQPGPVDHLQRRASYSRQR
ncbi:hypothetical protein DFH06DRAFT_1473081 [Mycena polygramma]|nr:hypothetical protein DFH06DRAFT_1473081 [Mycena polygramma]